MSDKAVDTDLVAPSQALKRRDLLLGAGAAAGAAVLAVKVIPGTAPAVATVAPTAAKVVDPRGGYQVTQHVLRYYETTRT